MVRGPVSDHMFVGFGSFFNVWLVVIDWNSGMVIWVVDLWLYCLGWVLSAKVEVHIGFEFFVIIGLLHFKIQYCLFENKIKDR